MGSVGYLNELGNNLRALYRTMNAEQGSEGTAPQNRDHEELPYLPGWVLQDSLLATTLELHFFSIFLGQLTR